jgi:hypothetical protein
MKTYYAMDHYYTKKHKNKDEDAKLTLFASKLLSK